MAALDSTDDGWPAVTLERRLEWPDTDAAGHQHHSVAMRWAEAAERELLETIDCAWLFSRTPRVRYNVQYRERIWFRDPVTIHFAIAAVGRSSMTYRFKVESPRGMAADGLMIVVHTDGNAGGATPWPDDIRCRLTGNWR